MPFIVDYKQQLEISDDLLIQPMAFGRLGEYKKIENIEPINITGEIIAYASPDSTYAVTRKLFDSAKHTIVIGIYDFSASYIKDIVLSARRRGVTVTIMIDTNKGETDEIAIIEELGKFGCETVQAPSRNSKKAEHYFTLCHEKIIIVDGIWTLIQSGNYSDNGIPFNEKDGGLEQAFITGNREMGIAIRSKELADFFKTVVFGDIKLALAAPELQVEKMIEFSTLELVEVFPSSLPVNLFPSKLFNISTPIEVLPVLSPDNYMLEVPELLKNAKKSILIQQQYIRSQQEQIGKLLKLIKEAKELYPNITVRIMLGKIFYGYKEEDKKKDYEKELSNIDNIKQKFGLALDINIRYVNTDQFVHCHNKLVIVDGKKVLISSQNWSDTGVASNREAGLIIEDPSISEYYSEIFESDWSNAFKEVPKPPTVISVEYRELSSGKFIKVQPGDYEEV